MKRNQGDAHNSTRTRRAVRAGQTSRKNSQAIQTLSPASSGFTSHGTPNHAPIASTAGQPGSTMEYQPLLPVPIR